MRLERIRIKRVMRGEDGAAWAAALEDAAWLAGASVLKDEPGSSWVRRANIRGRDVVVKCRLLDRRSRWLKSALGYGHADKQWRGAAQLAMKQIETARPIFAATAASGGTAIELLVHEYLAGPTVLHLLAAVARGEGPGVRQQHALAAVVGQTISRLVGAGLWNRDHKPSNLVVTSAGSTPQVAIIDSVGIAKYGWLGIDEGEAETMAASLMIEPLGCGCSPRRALWMRGLRAALDPAVLSGGRVERHAQLRAVLSDITAMIPAADAAKPKVDPLMSPSGR